MDQRGVARNLIFHYLESTKATEPENVEEIDTVLELLRPMWNIDVPHFDIPNVSSLLDLIPKQAYNTEKGMKLKAEGNTALTTGNLQLAIQKYTEAIAEDPTQETFFCNRAAAYSKLGQHEKAITDALKAISLKPTWATGYSRLGFAYFSLGNIEEARKAYQRGIDTCPQNESLKENLASLPSTGQQQAPGAGFDMNSLLQGVGSNPNFMNDIKERFQAPEVQAALEEPGMAELLAEIQTNPASLMAKMGDPRVQRLFGLLMKK